jgi:hypothetical protein
MRVIPITTQQPERQEPMTSQKQPIPQSQAKSDEGSMPFKTTDNTFLRQHLTEADLSIIHDQSSRKDFSHLTNQEVVSLFL